VEVKNSFGKRKIFARKQVIKSVPSITNHIAPYPDWNLCASAALEFHVPANPIWGASTHC